MNALSVPYIPVENFKEDDVTHILPEESESFNLLLKDLGDTKEKDIAHIGLILHGLGLGQYMQNFQKEAINLETFLNLNDKDLEELGITDANHKKIILKNLMLHKKSPVNFIVNENCYEDLRIARNIYNHLIFLQNYCSYIELQMRKHKLIDYKLNSKDFAAFYLKNFVSAALTQCKIMNEKLFNPHNFDNLLQKTLKVNNLTLPKHLENKLHSRKKPKNIIPKLITVIGLSSLFFLIVKHTTQ